MSGLYRWAPPTWIFFHTFAAKINKKFFEQNRAQCLAIIKMICSCLPCDECTGHAKQFMLHVNENTIKTKEELIQMLFVFHNSVNIRTGKKKMEKSILTIYNNYRIDIAYINFLNGYSAKYGALMAGMISTLGKRRATAKTVASWMQKHWTFFQ